MRVLQQSESGRQGLFLCTYWALDAKISIAIFGFDFLEICNNWVSEGHLKARMVPIEAWLELVTHSLGRLI